MSTNVSARQKYLLNKMNSISSDVQLGTLVEAIDTAADTITTLADGKILVGNASNVSAEVTPTGDVTITNAGVTAIGSAKVTKTMLATGVKPSHMVVYAGEFTTVGGDANEAITVTGAVATDLVHVTLHTKGSTPRTILTAQADTDVVNVEMSDDPSNDHILTYSVLRATT